MIEITTKDETDDAPDTPDLIQQMDRRWTARQDAIRQKQKPEEALGPLPTMVDFACMDPERGRYPKQPYVEMADGEFRMDSEYARFEPPSKVKIGSSGMTNNWGRYFRAVREWTVSGHTLDEAEKKIWTKYAGDLSTLPSTNFRATTSSRSKRNRLGAPGPSGHCSKFSTDRKR